MILYPSYILNAAAPGGGPANYLKLIATDPTGPPLPFQVMARATPTIPYTLKLDIDRNGTKRQPFDNQSKGITQV